MASKPSHWLTAFSRATGPRKYVLIGAAFAVAGVYEILRASLSRGDIVTLPDIPTWEIAIFASFALTAFWFLQRIVQLEREKQPKIEIHTGTVAPFIVQLERGRGEGGTEYNIRLQNTGETILQSCKANIEKVVLQDGEVLFEEPHPLRRADTGNMVFPLRGREKKFVNLFATLNGGFVRGKFFLGYHNREYSHQIPSANYRMVVVAYAEQGRPTEVVFDVTVDANEALTITMQNRHL